MIHNVSTAIVVSDALEVLRIHGDGVAPGDQIFWVEEGQGCYDVAVDLLESGNGVVPVDAAHDASFTFGKSSGGIKFWLCYSFGNESAKLYDNIVVSVSTLNMLTVLEGDNDTMVVDYLKDWNFHGGFLYPGVDIIKWIPYDSNCTNSDTVKAYSSEHGNGPEYEELGLGASLNVSQTASKESAGMKAALCYKHADKPYFKYSWATVEIKAMTGVESDVGDPRIAVVGRGKLYNFIGDYLENADTFRFVAGPSCSENITAIPLPGSASYADMDVQNSSYVNPIAFPSTYRGLTVNLCYRFRNVSCFQTVTISQCLSGCFQTVTISQYL
jgi:plastocyanin